jgi:transposase
VGDAVQLAFNWTLMHLTPKPRRRHSADFKAQVLAACAEPGASVAAVARAFELNDNLVHDWRRARSGAGAQATTSIAPRVSAPDFVALSLPAPPPIAAPPSAAAAPAEEIRMELKRGALDVRVTWPISAAADCAAWLREVLR